MYKAFMSAPLPHFIHRCITTCSGSLFISRLTIVIKSCSGKTFYSQQSSSQKLHAQKIKTARNYVLALGILTLGCSFAAVPLYRIFCQSSGFGGTVKHDIGGEKIEKMKKNNERKILVKFNSDLGRSMYWKFKPQQKEIVVVPGETALAFFSATNPTDKPIIGISTYNILPFGAAPYFNKIQCFCFEEQLLNPKEQVDMPVFFYIDPEFCEDPNMEFVNEITLSYTFFESKEGSSVLSYLRSST